MLRTQFRRRVRNSYVRWVRPRIESKLHQQRIKLAYYVWGYAPLLEIKTLTMAERLDLVAKCLRIDWNVVHGHRPEEVTPVLCTLARRKATDGEIMVEAGCWNGGSTAKFSLVCAKLGYQLHVYDSFEGVEQPSAEELAESFDYTAQYAAGEDTVRKNLAEYGDLSVCTLHKGWFSDTLAKEPIQLPVAIAYIDCDLASGTKEALTGIVPALSPDGEIFSQDFHIGPVRKLLSDPTTWTRLGKPAPQIWSRAQLARFYFA